MFTRRDVTKLAAALGLGAAATPKQLHAAALARYPTPDPAPPGTRTADDPARFAREFDGVLNQAVGDDDLPSIAPDEEAAFLRLRAECERAVPALVPLDTGREPWGQLQDAAYNWAIVAYMAGVEAGAAYEHLRGTLVGPRRPCPLCAGASGDWCLACGGAGTVRDRGLAG